MILASLLAVFFLLPAVVLGFSTVAVRGRISFPPAPNSSRSRTSSSRRRRNINRSPVRVRVRVRALPPIVIDEILNMDQPTAEALAGPLFGASLFPYLAFLYFLNRRRDEEEDGSSSCPPAVVVGFAACLVFVFLTIPAAIAAKLLYQVSLADADWLHGSAESTLTVANLALVLAFRSAVQQQQQQQQQQRSLLSPTETRTTTQEEQQASKLQQEEQAAKTTQRYVIIGCSVAILTALAPVAATFAASGGATFVPDVHAAYLDRFLDLPPSWLQHASGLLGIPYYEPANGLTVATWIIHIRYVRTYDL
jgi:Protein of unknown function (DUF3593)